jgi:hypothetical protein
MLCGSDLQPVDGGTKKEMKKITTIFFEKSI